MPRVSNRFDFPSSPALNSTSDRGATWERRPCRITDRSQPYSWPLCDIVSLCAQNFIPASELSHLSIFPTASLSRICGAWIEVLPSLLGNTANNNLLTPAIKALGVSIVARGHNGLAPIPDALQAQCVALHTLQGNIRHTSDSSFNALAAAMMCLFLSEVRSD